MSKYNFAITLFLVLVLVLDSCSVNHFQHSEQAPRKYRRYYQGKQRKNSRHRDTESYAKGYYQGKTEWLAQ